MAEEKYLAALKQGIINLDFEAVKKTAREAMEAGIAPATAITEGMVPGMAVVGDKFESGEYFLSELVVAGEVMREGVEIINPYIKADDSSKAKKVKAVLASVEGDNHDLGKNIVRTLLGVQGFEVIDLGMDVPADRIIEAVKEHKPLVLGLSALLTMTMPRMGEVIEELKAAGLRD
jgi:methanogenic corrinoid protein MtbC1